MGTLMVVVWVVWAEWVFKPISLAKIIKKADFYYGNRPFVVKAYAAKSGYSTAFLLLASIEFFAYRSMLLLFYKVFY